MRIRWAVCSLLFATACAAEAPIGDGDGVVSDDEVPEIGWAAELETFAHEVSGTAVLVDASTIEIRDFVYDGGGIDARFFLLPDGGTIEDAVEVTGNLVGAPASGETLTVSVPDGVSLEMFNLITLWCIPLSAPFGQGVFQPPGA